MVEKKDKTVQPDEFIHGAGSSASFGVDGRPILLRDASTLWSKLENERERIYAAFVQACVYYGVRAFVLKSSHGVHPQWVSFECWQPLQIQEGLAKGLHPEITKRSSATVTLDPKAYHLYEVEYLLKMNRTGKEFPVKKCHSLPDEYLQEIVGHLLGRGKMPPLKRIMFREAPLQLLRPKNKINRHRIGGDILLTLSVWLLLGSIGLFIVLADSQDNAIAVPLRLGAVLGLLLSALFIYLLSKRPLVVRNTGKPPTEPRFLTLVDSWQTVILGLGAQCQEMKNRFSKALAEVPAEKFRHQIEYIWYRGLDGIDSREQIVLSYNRGLVFCEIYPYGKDLYVGWDGHLNKGQWQETTISRGIDQETGSLAQFTSVQPGSQSTSEYDLMDLNFLMEWAHSQLVKILKQLLAEHQIDQEIDFKVARRDRENVLRGQTQSSASPAKKSLFGMFKRTS